MDAPQCPIGWQMLLEERLVKVVSLKTSRIASNDWR